MQKSLVQTPIRSFRKGFTIVELLVVVSIIALLVGILLPAIGKARDQAQLTRSQANIKQISTAIGSYAAEFGDRQPTWINDNISTYGNYTPGAAVAAFTNYAGQHDGELHPMFCLGYGRNPGPVIWFYAPPNAPQNATVMPFQPIVFTGTGALGGAFRIPNARIISGYLNGRYYDPVYYAPKDAAVMNSVESLLTSADEFPIIPNAPAGQNNRWSSYCLSPAAMFNPIVLSKNGNVFFKNPWELASGFKSPGMSQALYPNLKTHLLEHHWLQNRKKECHPSLIGPYEGCQPYYFNGAFNSQPVAAFYDGHVGPMSQTESIDANKRMVDQTGLANHGLWSLDTSFGPGGSYADLLGGGYNMNYCQDWSSTSYHVLTIEGIKGRDALAK